MFGAEVLVECLAHNCHRSFPACINVEIAWVRSDRIFLRYVYTWSWQRYKFLSSFNDFRGQRQSIKLFSSSTRCADNYSICIVFLCISYRIFQTSLVFFYFLLKFIEYLGDIAEIVCMYGVSIRKFVFPTSKSGLIHNVSFNKSHKIVSASHQYFNITFVKWFMYVLSQY